MIMTRNTKTVTRLVLQQLFLIAQLIRAVDVVELTGVSHYHMYNCPETENTYIAGSTFESVLDEALFSELPSKALKETFYSFTNGTGVDQVYALYYCRGDVTPSICRDCVQAAADKITAKCKLMREAIVWLEECTLRYANRNIFSIDEEVPNYMYTNKTGIINDNLLDPIKAKFDTAMSDLIRKVANSRNMDGFGTTEVSLPSSKVPQVLQCSVQCTPDIIGTPCEKCLTTVLNRRDKWADTMVFSPSCSLRLDLYNSTITNTTTHTGGLSKTVIIIVVVVVSVLVVVAAVLCHLLYYPDLNGVKSLIKFTYTELDDATDRFGVNNILGAGGFATVYRGTLKNNNKDDINVAVKRLDEEKYRHLKHLFLSELNNSCVNHKNIIKLIGYCNQGRHKMIVYELAENNSLHSRLRNTEHGTLNWETRHKIALGTATALRYLHKEGNTKIVHRDIKSSNILLDSDFVPKVADFGLAMVFPDDKSHVSVSKIMGTIGFIDPSSFKSMQVTEKADVYAFGIVLFELITGQDPTKLKNTPSIQLHIENTLLSLLEDLKKHDASKGAIRPKEPTVDGGHHKDEIEEDATNETAKTLEHVDPNLSTPYDIVGTVDGGHHKDEIGEDATNETAKTLEHVDPNLSTPYDIVGMARMITCAALCVHHSTKYRIDMSQAERLLSGGNLSATELSKIIAHARSAIDEPESSSSNEYPDTFDLDNLTKLATRVLKKRSSEDRRLTALNPTKAQHDSHLAKSSTFKSQDQRLPK